MSIDARIPRAGSLFVIKKLLVQTKMLAQRYYSTALTLYEIIQKHYVIQDTKQIFLAYLRQLAILYGQKHTVVQF